MSEHNTHIAMYEDTMRIILDAPEICDPFKKVIKKQYDSGLLGSGSRGNHLFAIPILESLKKKWDRVKDNREAQIKMAYAIGWICHRACDLQMKPVFRAAQADPDPRFDSQISSVYHDAMSFRKIFGGGTRASLSSKVKLSPATFDYEMQSHPAAKAIFVAKTEQVINRMWQKDLMEMAIFLNSEKNLETWTEKFVSVHPDFSEDFRNYESAYQDPDPVKVERYYKIDNMYADSDEIIQFVRAKQTGKAPKYDLPTVLEKAKDQSHYAQALRNGYFFVKGASDFFTDKIDKEAAYNAIQMNEQFRY